MKQTTAELQISWYQLVQTRNSFALVMGCCVTEVAAHAEGHTVRAETLGRAANVLLSGTGDTLWGSVPTPLELFPAHLGPQLEQRCISSDVGAAGMAGLSY